MHFTYTPSSDSILGLMRWAVEDLVTAEEYDHPVISREEALKRANEKLLLIQNAYKASIICEIKTRRGEWVTTA